jgi:hypothetical protein
MTRPASADEIGAVMDVLAGVTGARPITKATLSVATGIPVRRVEATIEHVRRESFALVCSSSAGYWLPGSLEEADANIERRHARAVRQLTTVQGERTLIRRLREGVDLTLFGKAVA